MSSKARQATLGGFVKGSKQKEAVPASDSGAPELDPAQANKSGPQLDSDSAQASVEGPSATLNSAENQELAAEQLSGVAVWAEFREEGRDRTLPNMFTMVSVGLVVPLNTACVERGFSHHGIIKNKLRNSLKVLQMDSLLRVKLLCKDYESFDYKSAAELHEQMQGGFISKLASEVDQLQFSKLDEETDDEAVIDFDAQESDSEASLSEYALSASDLEETPHEREMEVSMVKLISQML